MKRIEHYCSAVDQIKHEPKAIEEVLSMKQEKKQIKVTKGGRAVGAAVAAALVCANIAGGYWLLNRGNSDSLTMQTASAPIESELETTPAAAQTTLDAETAEKEAQTLVDIGVIDTSVPWAQEKPGCAMHFFALTDETLAEFAADLSNAGVPESERAKMLETLKYYAKNAVLKKNGNVIVDGDIALNPVESISDLDGFTMELHPDAEKEAPANCEFAVYAYLAQPDETGSLQQVKGKNHDTGSKFLLTDGETVEIPLELEPQNLTEQNIHSLAEVKDLVLILEVDYRPRVCTNEADEVEFVRTYNFTLSPEQPPVPAETLENTTTAVQTAEEVPTEATAAVTTASDKKETTSAAEMTATETGQIVEVVYPLNFITYDTDNDPNYDPDIIVTDAEWYELEKYYDGNGGVNGIENLKETEKVLTHYAKNAVLKQNGKALEGMFQKLSDLDGLTLEIRTDENEAVSADCGLEVAVILYTDKDEAWESRRQLKLSTGEFSDYLLLKPCTGFDMDFKPLIGDPATEKINTLEEADGCRVDVEVTYTPFVNQDDDDNARFTYIYTFMLDSAK